MSGRDENPARLVVIAGSPLGEDRLRWVLEQLGPAGFEVVVLGADEDDEQLRGPDIDPQSIILDELPTLSTFIVSGGLVQVEWRDPRRDFQADHGALAAARTHFRRPRPRPIDRQPRRRCQWLPGSR